VRKAQVNNSAVDTKIPQPMLPIDVDANPNFVQRMGLTFIADNEKEDRDIVTSVPGLLWETWPLSDAAQVWFLI
jgi:hypothetical protein